MCNTVGINQRILQVSSAVPLLSDFPQSGEREGGMVKQGRVDKVFVVVGANSTC